MTIEASKELLAKATQDLKEYREKFSKIKNVQIVYTSWYPEIISSLRESTQAFLLECGVPASSIQETRVSGSWELPLVVQEASNAQKSDLIITLGCVVKGATPHFDILCQAVSTGLMTVQLKSQTPLGFGVLTVNTLVEAQARADKGSEAAEAALRSWIAIQSIKGVF